MLEVTGRVGAEIEHFIFCEDGSAPDADHLRAFANALSLQGFSVSERAREGKEVSASFDDPVGTIILHNDFCTHVLEISLPPANTSSQLHRMHQETYERIGAALLQSGLSILDASFIHRIPEKLHFIEAATLAGTQRYEWFRNLQRPEKKYALPLFNAHIASVHIHIETSLDQMVPRLTALYESEVLIPLLFSNDSASGSEGVHCMRPLVWRDAFEDAYWACAIPKSIPTTWSAYQKLLTETKSIIPRDFSFICPRPEYGTLEFRSTCTHLGWEKLSAMIVVRMLSMLRALHNENAAPLAQSREIFYAVCERGSAAISDSSVATHLQELRRYAKELPEGWTNMIEDFDRILAEWNRSNIREVKTVVD